MLRNDDFVVQLLPFNKDYVVFFLYIEYWNPIILVNCFLTEHGSSPGGRAGLLYAC